MCCSRSLFWRSSWWTRAWASSRAVASALSWSFKRWTCNRRCEVSRVWWWAGRNGFSVMSEANLIQLTETFFPRLLLLSEFPKENNAPHPSLCEDQGQTVLTLPTQFSRLRNQRCVLFAANISSMATRKYKKFIYMLWMGPCCSFSEANDMTQGCCHSNASAFFFPFLCLSSFPGARKVMTVRGRGWEIWQAKESGTKCWCISSPQHRNHWVWAQQEN